MPLKSVHLCAVEGGGNAKLESMMSRCNPTPPICIRGLSMTSHESGADTIGGRGPDKRFTQRALRLSPSERGRETFRFSEAKPNTSLDDTQWRACHDH